MSANSDLVITQDRPGTVLRLFTSLRSPLTNQPSTTTIIISVPTRRVGTADIVGFGPTGVTLLRNSVSPTLSTLSLRAIGLSTSAKEVRLVGPTTPSGLSDLIAFSDAGVLVSRNLRGTGFDEPTLVLKDFGLLAGGWTVDRHVRYVADLRNTGSVDIIGFGDKGVIVSLNNGNGTYAPSECVLDDFGYDAGYRVDRHLRVLADVNGDGILDIVVFGEDAVYVALGKGDGTFEKPKSVLKDLTYSSGGWRVDKHPRTLADLTGKGRADIVGFGDGGVYVALSNGDGTFQPAKLALQDFGAVAGGWDSTKHLRYVADVNGDGLADIVGFGEAGFYIALGNGDGTFQAPRLALQDFAYQAGGWRVDKHPRFVVDVTGDGAADIVGFGNDAVLASYNDGKGNFGPVQKLTEELSLNRGWTTENSVRLLANM
ncbi:hypothetical protein MD484_g6043, partial [Candolleomyces efflorescens]